MRKIVCLATSPWYPIPTRKQQVMSRIPDAEILYFDPSVTYLAPLKDKAARPGLSNYKKEGVHPQENITVYSLPPVLPFFYKFRWINKLNQRRMARFVRRKMREHGFTDVLLWVYSPVTADLVDLVPHKGLVYDCVDRHSAYGGLMDPALVDRMELELAGKTDRTFATADALAEEVDYSDVDMVVLPGGIPGTPNLAANKTVTDTCAAFAKAGKKVAAICAAPSILASLGLLEGKNATAHAGFQDQLAGAVVHDEEIVVDGNITTSYGLGGAIPFALELVRQLAGPAEADRIQNAIAYRH